MRGSENEGENFRRGRESEWQAFSTNKYRHYLKNMGFTQVNYMVVEAGEACGKMA
jgi:hypothetical protein